MAPDSSTLAWKIPWTEEPGRLQSTGLRRVEHDWAASLSLFTFMSWRRKWQPTPMFLPGESQGRGAWWAAVYGVSQSWTRLKRLSSNSSSSIVVDTVVSLSPDDLFIKEDTQLLSCIWLFAPPWSPQAPLSIGFSRQEYRSELPFPSPCQRTQPHYIWRGLGTGTLLRRRSSVLMLTPVYVCPKQAAYRQSGGAENSFPDFSPITIVRCSLLLYHGSLFIRAILFCESIHSKYKCLT